MALFSERQQLASPTEIVDEAPEWLRMVFFNQVLKGFLHLDRKSSSDFFSDGASEMMERLQSPIGVKWLIERLAVLTKISPSSNYIYDEICQDALQSQLLTMKWFHFYDVLEIAGNALRTNDGKADYGHNRSFQRFRDKTNACFIDGGIGWRLNDRGLLERTMPAEVTEMEQFVFANSDPVAIHISNARGYLNKKPCDSANAIKESVCAVESLARTIDSKAATLGDAIDHLRKQTTYPPLMLSLVEKLWAFSNAEPGVRHGSPQEERVIRADAEFSYATSLAIIRYLRDSRK
jgi:hypothetical protein